MFVFAWIVLHSSVEHMESNSQVKLFLVFGWDYWTFWGGAGTQNSNLWGEPLLLSRMAMVRRPPKYPDLPGHLSYSQLQQLRHDWTPWKPILWSCSTGGIRSTTRVYKTCLLCWFSLILKGCRFTSVHFYATTPGAAAKFSGCVLQLWVYVLLPLSSPSCQNALSSSQPLRLWTVHHQNIGVLEQSSTYPPQPQPTPVHLLSRNAIGMFTTYWTWAGWQLEQSLLYLDRGASWAKQICKCLLPGPVWAGQECTLSRADMQNLYCLNQLGQGGNLIALNSLQCCMADFVLCLEGAACKFIP